MACPDNRPALGGGGVYSNHKRAEGAKSPYDIEKKKSGDQDATFMLGANFRGAKMACLGLDKVIKGCPRSGSQLTQGIANKHLNLVWKSSDPRGDKQETILSKIYKLCDETTVRDFLVFFVLSRSRGDAFQMMNE